MICKRKPRRSNAISTMRNLPFQLRVLRLTCSALCLRHLRLPPKSGRLAALLVLGLLYFPFTGRSSGLVIGWGSDYSGETEVPAGVTNVLAIASGGNDSMVLQPDGTVIMWGANFNGETNVPA